MSENNNQQPKGNYTDRLKSILGGDPSSLGGGSGVLSSALEQVRKEKQDAARIKAVDLVKKALELDEKIKSAERQFMQEKNKVVKELNNLLNTIDKLGSGGPQSSSESEEEQPQ
jgi:hypothetical protein